MSSNIFWQRWWHLLRYQPAVWWFALIQTAPAFLLLGFGFVLLNLMPSLDAPPFVWEHWFQQQGLAVLSVLGLGSMVIGLLMRVLAWWAQAGTFTLARRVLGREQEPLPWSEARCDLTGPTLRLMLLDVVLGLALIALVSLFIGLIIVLGVQTESEEAVIGLFLMLLCGAIPVAVLVVPWIQAARVAAVVEHPASWGETWQAYWEAMRRGWLGMYGMMLIAVGIGMAVSFIGQIVQIPFSFASTWMGQSNETAALLLQALSGGLISILLGVPQAAIMHSGWAALYLHYRHDEAAVPDPTPFEMPRL